MGDPERQHAVVNGSKSPLPADGRRLVHWLREDLGLIGTKHPCGRGHCGGCSVLVDGQVILACSTLATVLGGATITTIEGLVGGDLDDPLVEAFVTHGALQCGFCTPGMIVAARAFLATFEGESYGDPIDEDSIRVALAGNICRCTGYTQIVRAVMAVGERETDHRAAQRAQTAEATQC